MEWISYPFHILYVPSSLFHGTEPSDKVDSYSASQGIATFYGSRKQKLNYILSQFNPVYTLKYYFFKVGVKLYLCLTKFHAMKMGQLINYQSMK